jgi:D-glycero-D-manno-heptose 1,7-bisphosphate phosphatase
MKLVILERDGVINERQLADVLIEGSVEALAQLHQSGFTVIIATNQGGLAQGLFDLDELEAVHRTMIAGHLEKTLKSDRVIRDLRRHA